MGEAVAGLDRHLLQTLFSRYALLQHCDALKRYMLLGQGDFIESLMNLIGTQLDKPVRLPTALHVFAAARLRAAGQCRHCRWRFRGRAFSCICVFVQGLGLLQGSLNLLSNC